MNINVQSTFGIYVPDDPIVALQVATKAYVDNVTISGSSIRPFSNDNIAIGTSNVFYLAGNGLGVTNASNTVLVYMDTIFQPNSEYTYNTGNNTVQIHDASIPAGIQIYTVAWQTVP